MSDFEYSFIAQICDRNLHLEDVKVVLNIIKPYLTDEQIFEINKDAQKCFDDMCKAVLDNSKNTVIEDVELEEDLLDENTGMVDWRETQF